MSFPLSRESGFSDLSISPLCGVTGRAARILLHEKPRGRIPARSLALIFQAPHRNPEKKPLSFSRDRESAFAGNQQKTFDPA